MISNIGKAKKERNKSSLINSHRIAVPEMIRGLVEQADIILEVLDSRFIAKTRNIEVEKNVKEQGKKIIYVLSKSDLVDIDKIKKNIELSDMKPGLFFSSRERKGSGTLKKLIKIEASKLNKELVQIGVVGYPNSGKSSLINYLVGKSVSRTSSEAGYTKGIQKIKISKGIYLIDTPGIIPPEEKKVFGSRRKHFRVGALTWDKAKDPDLVISDIVEEFPGVLEKHYGIDSEKDTEIFIEKLGRKWNFLKKGDLIDDVRTAKKILRDWQEGKIVT